ncbi:hypothetical protein WR38_23455, partial [Vibrio parahaemolyticus]
QAISHYPFIPQTTRPQLWEQFKQENGLECPITYHSVGFEHFYWFIADKRELKTKTVVSDRVLSPNKTYTNYRFHVESYFPIFILA